MAFAVSQSHLVVVSTPWLYQFLFVAVWCVNMLDRVLKIFRGGPAAYSDECLLFAKKHCFVISLLIVVAAVTGLWIMFFQLGVVIFQFALLPGICSLLFLYFSSNPHKKGSLSSGFVMASFFAAVSFSTGAESLPTSMERWAEAGAASCPRPPGISSPWSSSACSAANGGMKKRRKTGRTPPPGHGFPGLDGGDCDLRRLLPGRRRREYTGDAWIYYGLAMAGVFMFVLDRLKKNMPPLLLYTLSWVALIFPLLLSGILAQASS